MQRLAISERFFQAELFLSLIAKLGVMKTQLLRLVLLMKQKLMRDLEVKEKDLNKLKAKTDALLKANHPASDKIEVKFRDPVL